MRKTRLVILPGARSLTQMCCLLLYLSCPSIGASCREHLDLARDDLYSLNIRKLHRNINPLKRHEEMCSITESWITCRQTDFDYNDGQQTCFDANQNMDFETESFNSSRFKENSNRLVNDESFQRVHADSNQINEVNAMNKNRHVSYQTGQTHFNRRSTQIPNFYDRDIRKEPSFKREQSRNAFTETDRRTRGDYDRRSRVNFSRKLTTERRENKMLNRVEERYRETFRKQSNSRLDRMSIRKISRFQADHKTRRNTEEHINRFSTRAAFRVDRISARDQNRLNRNNNNAQMIRKRSVESIENEAPLDQRTQTRTGNSRLIRYDRVGRGSVHERSSGQYLNERYNSKPVSQEFITRRQSDRSDIRRKPNEIGTIRVSKEGLVNSRSGINHDVVYQGKYTDDTQINKVLSDRRVNRIGRIITSRQNTREIRHFRSPAIVRRDNIRFYQDRSTTQNTMNQRNRLNIVDKHLKVMSPKLPTFQRNINDRESLDQRYKENEDGRVSQYQSARNNLQFRNSITPRQNEQFTRKENNRQIISNNNRFKNANIRSTGRELSHERKVERMFSRDERLVRSRSVRRENHSAERRNVITPIDARNRNRDTLSRNSETRRALLEIDNNIQNRRMIRDSSNNRRDVARNQIIQQGKHNDRTERLYSENYHFRTVDTRANERVLKEERYSDDRTNVYRNSVRNSRQHSRDSADVLVSPLNSRSRLDRKSSRRVSGANTVMRSSLERTTRKHDRSSDERFTRQDQTTRLHTIPVQSRAFDIRSRRTVLDSKRFSNDRRSLPLESGFRREADNRRSNRIDVIRNGNKIEMNRLDGANRRVVHLSYDNINKNYMSRDRYDFRRFSHGIRNDRSLDRRQTQETDLKRSIVTENEIDRRSNYNLHKYNGGLLRTNVRRTSDLHKSNQIRSFRFGRESSINIISDERNSRNIKADRRLDSNYRQMSDKNSQNRIARVSRNEPKLNERIAARLDRRQYSLNRVSLLSQARINIKNTNNKENSIHKNSYSQLTPYFSETNSGFNTMNVINGFNSSSENKQTLENENVMILNKGKLITDEHSPNSFSDHNMSDAVLLEAKTTKKWSSVTKVITDIFSSVREMKEETKIAVVGSIAFMLLTPGTK